MSSKNGLQLLARLREQMKKAGVSAWYIPTADPHMSEYVAPAFARRSYVSGFQGSAGTAVVTATEAKLWTDGRYWLEAADSMNEGFELMKDGKPETPSPAAWLAEHLNISDGAKVGVDPFCTTIDQWQTLSKEIPTVHALSENLVDNVWKEDGRPPLPTNPVFQLSETFAGRSVEEKLKQVRDAATKAKCQLLILSALDDIAWLLNLRGSDVNCNPVFYAYCAVEVDGPAHLFINQEKVSEEIAADLQKVNVQIHGYDALEAYFQTLPKDTKCSVDERQISFGLKMLLEGAGVSTKNDDAPVKKLKALKNPVELEGFYACHRRDGAALTCFLAWLENAIQSGEQISEFDAASKLEEYRRKNEQFVQLSFPTISGSGPNGAVIHYRCEKDKCRMLSKDEMYLVDSGAQYWDGTTDVTRTVVFSEPSEKQVAAYTAVLKGHIAINSCVFPKGVAGHRIDALARHALWGMGLDYAHGTGHGVGHFLNVHEGPHGIGSRPLPGNPPLEATMIVSNEPGYYEDGAFGIRIENLETIVPKATKYGGENSSLGFDALTMAPLCPKLIDVAALTAEEKAWVNRYHAKVREQLLPLIPESPPLYREYLLRNTATL